MDTPPGPPSRSWSFSFSVTRTYPDGSGDTALALAKRLSAADLLLIAGALTLLVLEPFAVYMYLTHHKGLVLAEACASNPNVVVYHAQPEGGALQKGTAPGDPVGQNSDVITPLNVRDPSSLVMTPGP